MQAPFILKICHPLHYLLGFPCSSVGKSLPAVLETWVRSLGWEDPLEKEMATHSSILAWKISWTEEPGGLESRGLKESGMTEQLTLNFTICRTSLVAQMVSSLLATQEIWVQSLGQEDPLRREWQPIPVFLPGKSHGQRSMVGYSPWGLRQTQISN